MSVVQEEDLFNGKPPYPAEMVFDSPKSNLSPSSQPCSATYGLSVGHSWLKLSCELGTHGKSWHAAPLADGSFRWPHGAIGTSEPRIGR